MWKFVNVIFTKKLVNNWIYKKDYFYLVNKNEIKVNIGFTKYTNFWKQYKYLDLRSKYWIDIVNILIF